MLEEAGREGEREGRRGEVVSDGMRKVLRGREGSRERERVWGKNICYGRLS